MKINITIQLEDVEQETLDALLGSVDPDLIVNANLTPAQPAPKAKASKRSKAKPKSEETVAPESNEPPGVNPNWNLSDASDAEMETAAVDAADAAAEIEAEDDAEEPQPNENRLIQDADEHVVKERFIDLADSNYDAAAGLLQKLGVARFGELDAAGHAKLAAMMDDVN